MYLIMEMKHYAILILQNKLFEKHCGLVLKFLASNHTKSVLRPEDGWYDHFQNFKWLIKAPFIIYGDFECISKLSTDNMNAGWNTKKYQDHAVWCYSYKLICVDDQYSKPYKTYFGEDAVDRF